MDKDRCEMTVECIDNFEDGRYTDVAQCSRKRKYEVNGAFYCTQHAKSVNRRLGYEMKPIEDLKINEDK